MSLILHPDQLTDSRIRHAAGGLGVSNPQLVENCLHAFALLGYLSQSGLPFLFKGGTSVLLHAVQVTIPTVPALLGDKLTAFAPNTIGVRYTNHKGEEGDLMQIGKQLFDIGELFDICSDLSACHGTHRSSFGKENGYRGDQFTYEQVLDDSLAAALAASFRNPLNPESHDRMIQRCVRPLASHLVGCPFGAPQAAEAAGKVAILIALLQCEKAPETISPMDFAVPADITLLKTMKIAGPWSFLTKIKGSAPRAFHYWYQASNLHRGYLNR